jgi:hypothetical protein
MATSSAPPSHAARLRSTWAICQRASCQSPRHQEVARAAAGMAAARTVDWRAGLAAAGVSSTSRSRRTRGSAQASHSTGARHHSTRLSAKPGVMAMSAPRFSCGVQSSTWRSASPKPEGSISATRKSLTCPSLMTIIAAIHTAHSSAATANGPAMPRVRNAASR